MLAYLRSITRWRRKWCMIRKPPLKTSMRCILRHGHTRLEHTKSFRMLQRSWYYVTLCSLFKKFIQHKTTIYSTFLQRCSFKFVLLIQIRGQAVTYRSAVGPTVPQARVHQVWTLERSEMRNFSNWACVSGLTHSHAYEWSQWNKKCSVTAPLGESSLTTSNQIP